MKEDFLQFIWRQQLFNHSDLYSKEGATIEIITAGTLNLDEGPDFFNSKILINDQLWGGNIEIHINGEDWYNHGHHINKKYNNTILHVVWSQEKETITEEGRIIPTIELKDRVEPHYLSSYKSLMRQTDTKPCDQFDLSKSQIHIFKEVESSVLDRIKTKISNTGLTNFTGDFPLGYFRLLIASFGFGVNSPAFSMISQLFPFKLIQKSTELQTESLLFGLASFLNKRPSTEHGQLLYAEWKFLSKKYNLTPIPFETWKFSKMRPSNSPYLRLAQLNSILRDFKYLYSNVNTEDLKLKSVISKFWISHYNLDSKRTRNISNKLPESLVKHIITNVNIPFKYLKAEYEGVEFDIEEVYSNLPFEDNRITRSFNLTIDKKSAFISQGLIQIHKTKCEHKKCLTCAIGAHIIRKGNVPVHTI